MILADPVARALTGKFNPVARCEDLFEAVKGEVINILRDQKECDQSGGRDASGVHIQIPPLLSSARSACLSFISST
jgi:hypothetical protein